ncbi:unnamed protein product [Meganyctiphanes norvegica]|uniref:WAP domain-containing protein n=1 Tax=Meganyctiphanes norvegica TaxID=48144 RepID=A0AAV2R7D0_MEGNR
MKLMCLSLLAVMVAAMVGVQSADSLHSRYYNILASPADKGFWLPPGAPVDFISNAVAGSTGGSPGGTGAASGTAAGSSGSSANRIPTGSCPPIRTFCPSFLPTPKACVYDPQCFAYQKCCYDRCYRRRVCKTKYFG